MPVEYGGGGPYRINLYTVGATRRVAPTRTQQPACSCGDKSNGGKFAAVCGVGPKTGSRTRLALCCETARDRDQLFITSRSSVSSVSSRAWRIFFSSAATFAALKGLFALAFG